MSSLWKPSRAEVTMGALCPGGPFYCGIGVDVLNMVRETDRGLVTVVGRNVTGHMPVKTR